METNYYQYKPICRPIKTNDYQSRPMETNYYQYRPICRPIKTNDYQSRPMITSLDHCSSLIKCKLLIYSKVSGSFESYLF